MKKRTVLINFRVTADEAFTLTARAKSCGYSREAYIRSLLNGRIPRPIPPPDYHAMTRELKRIGNSLNQIAQKAHVLGFIDAPRYDDALRAFRAALAAIEAAVILPVKVQ